MKLKEDRLYLGDNGRCFCGRLRCAGMTAFYSGRDLSGQAVEPITHPDDLRYALAHGLKCERCGQTPQLVTA